MAESVNAVEAWLGSLPGHAYANVRQPPFSTLNLAHMIPFSAVWAGPERDEHFERAAAVLRQDRRLDAVPVLASCRRCRPHAGGRADRRRQVRAAGADGAAIPALSAALRFSLSTSAARSAPRRWRWAATGTISAAPRRRRVGLSRCSRLRASMMSPSAPGPRDWIVDVLTREGITITPEVKEHLWTALTSLASAPVAERTLTGLSVLLQSQALKRALQPYCVGGPYGRLLDAETERLGDGVGAGIRDRRADRHRRRSRRARLSLPSHRRPPRRPADAADHR